jgi:hypothetical protein
MAGLDNLTLARKEGWRRFVEAPARAQPETLSRDQIRRLDDAVRTDYDRRRREWHANLGPLRTPQLAEHTMTADGTWTIKFRTPSDEREAKLVIKTDGTTLSGTFDGAHLNDGRVDDTEVTFSAKLTTPFKVKIKCVADIDGDTITNKANAAIMTIPFPGTRDAN